MRRRQSDTSPVSEVCDEPELGEKLVMILVACGMEDPAGRWLSMGGLA